MMNRIRVWFSGRRTNYALLIAAWVFLGLRSVLGGEPWVSLQAIALIAFFALEIPAWYRIFRPRKTSPVTGLSPVPRPLYAVRSFFWDFGTIKSLVVQGWGNWEMDKWLKAECPHIKAGVAHSSHGEVPDLDCSCGFWAIKPEFRSQSLIPGFGTNLVGVVELGGAIIEHDFGYRAEMARLVKTWRTPLLSDDDYAGRSALGKRTQFTLLKWLKVKRIHAKAIRWAKWVTLEKS